MLKSVALLSVSVHPLDARNAAVVLLGAGVGPEPSKQVVLPKPTKSIMVAPVGQLGTVSVTGLLNPAVEVTVIVELPEPPCVTVKDVGLADSE